LTAAVPVTHLIERPTFKNELIIEELGFKYQEKILVYSST